LISSNAITASVGYAQVGAPIRRRVGQRSDLLAALVKIGVTASRSARNCSVWWPQHRDMECRGRASPGDYSIHRFRRRSNARRPPSPNAATSAIQNDCLHQHSVAIADEIGRFSSATDGFGGATLIDQFGVLVQLADRGDLAVKRRSAPNGQPLDGPYV